MGQSNTPLILNSRPPGPWSWVLTLRSGTNDTKNFIPKSWYQDTGTKILVPRSWYQAGTKILLARSCYWGVPRSWYLVPGPSHQDLDTRMLVSEWLFLVHEDSHPSPKKTSDGPTMQCNMLGCLSENILTS